MAFIKKESTSGGDTFSFENVGQKLTGYYLGTFPHPEGKYGPTVKHLFKTDKGIKCVFGQKFLTDELQDVQKGLLIEVTYTGDKPPANGKKGNAMKLYEIGLDDQGRTLNSAEIPDMVEDAAEPDYGDEPADSADDEVVPDEVKVSAPAPRPAVAKSALEAKARAEAVMKARKVG